MDSSFPLSFHFQRESFSTFKGQLKCLDKLTSITRFEALKTVSKEFFIKFVFVFEIWAVVIFVFTDSEVSKKGRGNVRSIP